MQNLLQWNKGANKLNNNNSHVCPWWIAYTFDHPLRCFFTPPKKVLNPYLSEGMTFVDFGCGMGFFSIRGAKIVGNSGKVISVDIQPKMLEVLEKRAKKAGINDIIQTHLSQHDNINLNINADFALAMWMVHETTNFNEFFRQAKSVLKEESNFLVVEPTHHVSANTIEKEIEAAKQADFEFCGFKDIGLLSKGFLLRA